MRLVRAILDQVAAADGEVNTANIIVEPADFSGDDVAYHVTIMTEAGLLTCIQSHRQGARQAGARYIQLTWHGHEVHDTLRDDDVWHRTQSGLSKLGGWSLSLGLDVAKAYAKQVAREKLGLHLD